MLGCHIGGTRTFRQESLHSVIARQYAMQSQFAVILVTTYTRNQRHSWPRSRANIPQGFCGHVLLQTAREVTFPLQSLCAALLRWHQQNRRAHESRFHSIIIVVRYHVLWRRCTKPARSVATMRLNGQVQHRHQILPGPHRHSNSFHVHLHLHAHHRPYLASIRKGGVNSGK